jgi:GntR family transcriptional regulator, rspAB operon transcriptional repressor
VHASEIVALSPIRRLGSEPARTRAYAALREAIVAMELPPGARLSENELAARLGVSRTPVREALIRLRDEQLVEIAPQRGTFVTPISVRGVLDAQFVREALECAAVRLAAEHATDDDVTELWAMIDAQHRSREAGDLEAFYRLDEAFHTRLSDLSGHLVASTIAQRAKGHLNRVRRLSLPRPHYIEEMIAEHEAVVAAVGDHDPHTAEHALRHHLRMVLSELPRIRAEHPELFDDDPGALNP